MNKSALIGFVSIVLFACNGNEKKKIPEALSKEEELKQSLLKYPDSLIVIENIVQYYRDNGNYAEALRITNEAIRKDSGEAAFWDMKATLHFEDGDTLGAIDAYNKLISIEQLPEHIIALGSVYAQMGNTKALEIADELIDTYKSRAEKEALLIKGMYYNFTGNKKAAISYFDACLALDFNYLLAYREKAIALYDLGMYADALKVLESATALQNSFEEGYYWMGRCYEKLGKTEDAMKAYHMALLYDKDYVEAKDALKRIE